MSRNTRLEPTIATAPARRIGVAPIRVARAPARRAGRRGGGSRAGPDESRDEPRRHEDEAGLERPPPEHVLEIQGRDEVERRRGAEEEQGAQVRADQQSGAQDPESDERLLNAVLDSDEERSEHGRDPEGTERPERGPAR